MPEAAWLWAALAAYAAGLALAVPAFGAPAAPPAARAASWALALLWSALALHTVALATRWQALGHGPFTTLHEILSSNLWSLALVLLAAAALLRDARAALAPGALVLAVLALWLATTDAGAGHFPATYATPLLYLHTVVGKLFLGLLLVATGLGAVPLLRSTAAGRRACAALPGDRRLDALAHHFAAFAFVFETLMLIAGAVWAQDAWGRYWAWDPLETWAFLTWIALAAVLHARSALRLSPAAFGLGLAAAFVLAFLTFFGVPFISTAPHKGAV